MFLIAFGLSLGFGIKSKKAPYFCLLVNIILSTLVTAILAFWYYKGILKTSYLWYIFLQCTFLFFQLVTTDIFAVLAATPSPPHPHHPPLHRASHRASQFHHHPLTTAPHPSFALDKN
eukprot:Em0002g1867a